jgi:hypothetical protein
MGPYSSIAGLIQSLLQGKKQTEPNIGIPSYDPRDIGGAGVQVNNIMRSQFRPQTIESPDAVAGAENAAIEAKILADQNVNGMGYDYTNEGYASLAKRVPIGRAYPGERTDFVPSSQADWSRAVAMPRPSEMIGQHADWSTPASAVSSGPTFAERDMLASAGENRDLLGIGQPVGLPPVDPREIAIKKRFGQNVGNLWGDVRLRERMQDLYGGSL